MLNGVGGARISAGTSGTAVRAPASSASTAGLQAQISQYKSELNDWVTCVSANTPKGQEEILSISGKISAAKAEISRINAAGSAAQGVTPPHSRGVTAATAIRGALSNGSTSALPAKSPFLRSSSIDVWA